ncbi:hypothetical protein C5615_22315 [Burkholderia cepacia]|uniref:Uncharacterized protein n=1 Tax=Burkholderia cepacia TaxID=292 RepID=A0A2S8ILN5_BURCE|nr:hypothetical protein C5615_22315 [Burkholderia cepacia]
MLRAFYASRFIAIFIPGFGFFDARSIRVTRLSIDRHVEHDSIQARVMDLRAQRIPMPAMKP